MTRKEAEAFERLINSVFGMGDIGDETHYHKCPNGFCNTVWHHVRNKIEDSPECYLYAHICPKCGVENRYKHKPTELEENEAVEHYGSILSLQGQNE